MEKIYSLPHTPSPSWEMSFIRTFFHGIFMNGSYWGFAGYFQCFFFAFCSILLHFLANTPLSSRFKRCLPASCLSAFIGSALSVSLWSQNHSASLCLSIGEGGLYSHPRYRRSFIATWQKTQNLFKSLQNRLSKNIKNLYLYLITWEMVWHCMVLSWNLSFQSFEASRIDKFHVWGRHRIPAEEGNGLYWISSDQGHDRVQECGMGI